VGIASAIPVIAGWERTLEATGLPELASLAENLKTLRIMLSPDDSDPAEVVCLLNLLGEQVRVVAATPQAAYRGPLAQPTLLLNAGSVNLAGQARS
jgi:hypothetical protein